MSLYTLTAECLERGLHVMVEKPITETIEQAQQLVQMADERGLILQVGHIERFNPAFIELKHVTEDMSLIGINMRRLGPFDTSNTDVDVIRDLMIHDLDLALNFVDCVRENRPSQVPGSDSLHALQLAEAVASEIARKMNSSPKGLSGQAASAVALPV